MKRELGKPSQPEVLSLCVDWLPARFADPEEYPRPRAWLMSLQTQGREARVQGQGTGSRCYPK